MKRKTSKTRKTRPEKKPDVKTVEQFKVTKVVKFSPEVDRLAGFLESLRSEISALSASMGTPDVPTVGFMDRPREEKILMVNLLGMMSSVEYNLQELVNSVVARELPKKGK